MKIRTAALFALLIAVPVYADDTPAPASDNSSGPVPVNTSVVDVATRRLKAAQAEFDAFVEARRKEFSEGQVYIAAKKAVDDAAAEVDAMEAPIREKLKASDSHYAQALQDIIPAREKLAEAISNKKPDDIAFRRSDVKYYQDLINKAEAPVFARNEALQAARKTLGKAREELASMQKRFNDTLNADQDYRALSRALNNAKSRLAAAQSTGR
jgi:hypothetical protein